MGIKAHSGKYDLPLLNACFFPANFFYLYSISFSMILYILYTRVEQKKTFNFFRRYNENIIKNFDKNVGNI